MNHSVCQIASWWCTSDSQRLARTGQLDLKKHYVFDSDARTTGTKLQEGRKIFASLNEQTPSETLVPVINLSISKLLKVFVSEVYETLTTKRRLLFAFNPKHSGFTCIKHAHIGHNENMIASKTRGRHQSCKQPNQKRKCPFQQLESSECTLVSSC